MGVERVDYSSDEEFRQALAEEENYYRDASYDDSDHYPEVPLGPCYICGKETDWWEVLPEENLCPACSALNAAEQVIVLNKRMEKDKQDENGM